MTDLTVTGLTKAFGRTQVLSGVDLHVPTGSLTAVLGRSGCGKTTLLRLVAGFEQPDDGTIQIAGTTVAEPGRAAPPERRRIGYVAQEGALFPHLSVAANIGFGLPRRLRRDGHRVTRLLEMVGLDAEHARRYPHQLSGGQQQRVALARALAPEPAIVLLDEPFASLDADLRESTRRAVVQALAEAGTTAVLVTHDQAEALSLASQVAVMRGGTIAQVDTPAALYRSPVDADLAAFLGDAVLLPGTVGEGGAECLFGRLPVRDGTPRGPAELMIRPEQIVIAAADGTSGLPATVTGVDYYGHDATVRLNVPAGAAGAALIARSPAHLTPEPGATVRIHVHGEVTVYRTDADATVAAGSTSD